MAFLKRTSWKDISHCLVCWNEKPKDRADSPYCSRNCLRLAQDLKRKQYRRAKRERDAKRRKHRCLICGIPVGHPRKYCAGHICPRCEKAVVKTKGLCWKCYIRQYRASAKQASSKAP